MPPTPLVSVTDHAVERYLQRVRGTLDARSEIASRVSRAFAAGRAEAGDRGDVLVRDGSLVFVCVHDRPRSELVVVTVWEEAGHPKGPAAVPRRYTDALRGSDPRPRRAG